MKKANESKATRKANGTANGSNGSGANANANARNGAWEHGAEQGNERWAVVMTIDNDPDSTAWVRRWIMEDETEARNLAAKEFNRSLTESIVAQRLVSCAACHADVPQYSTWRQKSQRGEYDTIGSYKIVSQNHNREHLIIETISVIRVA